MTSTESRRINAVGLIVGKLTVLEELGSNNSLAASLLKCFCDGCKRDVILQKRYVIQKKRMACKDCTKEEKKSSRNLTIGQKFGRLTVISNRVPHPVLGSDSVYFNCKCDCGKQTVVKRRALINGTSKSCGCAQLSADRTQQIHRQLYSHLITRSIRLEMEPNLSYEDFIKLIYLPCNYCGRESTNTARDYKDRQGNYLSDVTVEYNGIDRIDSNKGYIKGNVTTCCKFCNRMKMDHSTEFFKEQIARIYNHFVFPPTEYS